ncbi:MAG: hypothetical protein LBH22_04575 [Bacteroidales bacterium]|jgi:hypothetical protein|nr:hypothetical protein [Bacteroidales bacterium]
MNKTFNIARFGKFFCMEFRQYKKLFLILAGVTLIDLVLSMASFARTYQMVTEVDNIEVLELNSTIANMVHQAKLGVSPIQFGGAFGILLLIVPFLMYNFVYHPTKSFTYSMLPASWLEKFASAWVMCVIAVPLMLFGFALLVAFIGDLLGAQVSYHTLNLNVFLKTIYLPTIIVQSVMFWGAFWFKRQKVGKTILTIAIVVIGLIILAWQMQDILRDLMNFLFGPPYSEAREQQLLIWLRIIPYALMTLLWSLALIKYPRTQI